MTSRRAEASFLVAGFLVFSASVAGTVYWHEWMPSHGMPMSGSWSLSPMWMRVPGQTWLSAVGGFVGVWTVMMLAMMLPSLLPTLSQYRRSVSESQPGVGHLTIAAGGYFLVWIFFGVVAYAMANILIWAELSWPAFAGLAPLAAGIVVWVVGLVQLTPRTPASSATAATASEGGRPLPTRSTHGATAFTSAPC